MEYPADESFKVLNTDGFENRYTDINLKKEISSVEAVADNGVRLTTKDDESVVHHSRNDSSYNIRVRRLVAIDSTENNAAAPDTNEAGQAEPGKLTLLILDYEATCDHEDGRYSSIRTWVDIEDAAETLEGDRAKPEVLSWAPFEILRRFNTSEEEVKTTQGGDAEAGITYMADAKMGIHKEREASKHMKFFTEGFAQARYAGQPKVLNGVKWVLKENKSLESGVPPKFRTALLIRRRNDNPVMINYGFRCFNGPFSRVTNTLKSVFGYGPHADVRIRYTPNQEQPRYAEQDGEELLEDIKQNIGGFQNLHTLYNRKEKRLESLTWVWGLEPIKTASPDEASEPE